MAADILTCWTLVLQLDALIVITLYRDYNYKMLIS